MLCWVGRVAAGLRHADLRKIHVFVSDPARTHLRPAEAPSAQIRRGSALETDTPERTGQSPDRFSKPNVVVLKNKMGHQVDADGKLRRGT